MELRLFPLQTVLFPGMQIPLNVFEPRYLQLVKECTDQDEPFGIALIREGPEVGGPAVPFAVGTTARIEHASPGVLNAISLVARGEQRFRISELHHDRPYLWADAVLIEEQPDAAPHALSERAQRLLEEFERLRLSASGGYVRPSVTEGAAAPAGVIADAIGATGAGSATERQQLLELLDPGERLERALAMFEPLIEQMRRLVVDKAVSRWNQPGALN